MRNLKLRLATMALVLFVALVGICTNAYAQSGTYVYDTMDLLSSSDFETLESRGRDYAERYNMGVYFLTCQDMGTSNPTDSERNEFAKSFFLEKNLGVGKGKQGIIFVVASVSRDYVTVKHIGPGEPDPFSNDCVDALEYDAKEYLSENDWSGAAKSYYDSVSSQLEYYAQNGEAWTEPDIIGFLLKVVFTFALPLMIALAFVVPQYRAMKTARQKVEASGYESQEGLNLTLSRDMFTHRTTSVRSKPKHDSDSGGGWSSSGGGFSGSGGGKF